LAARRISLGVTGFFLAATSAAPPYGCFAFPSVPAPPWAFLVLPSGCSRLRFLWLWRSPPPLAMVRRWLVREESAVGGAGFFLRSLAETRVYGQGAASTGAMCPFPWGRLLGRWPDSPVQKARPVWGDISRSFTWAETRFSRSDQSNGAGSVASIRTEGGRIEGFPRPNPIRSGPLVPAEQQAATWGPGAGRLLASRPCLVRRAAQRGGRLRVFWVLVLSVWCV
jgi:hypothetical protein